MTSPQLTALERFFTSVKILDAAERHHQLASEQEFKLRQEIEGAPRSVPLGDLSARWQAALGAVAKASADAATASAEFEHLGTALAEAGGPLLGLLRASVEAVTAKRLLDAAEDSGAATPAMVVEVETKRRQVFEAAELLMP